MLKSIIDDTISSLADNSLTLLKVTVVPIILMFGLEALRAATLTLETYQVFLFQIADSIIWALFAISIHRVILLGESSVGPLGNIRLKSRELMYIAYGFLIGIVIGFIVFFLGLIPILGFILAITLTAIFLSRISILLPAVAVDNNIGVRRVWELSDGYTLTCVGSVVLIPLILAFPLYFQTDTLYSSIVTVVYGSIVMIVSVTLLSNTYKNLINIGIRRDEEQFSG